MLWHLCNALVCWGPCLYFTRGYIGFRLVKNLTPPAPEWTLESFPREEKSTGPLVHCANLQEKKGENLFYEPLRLFPSGGFYTLPYTTSLHVVSL